MKGRNVIITLLLILGLLLLAIYKRWHEPRVREPFNRSAPLTFTAFAICQLHCKKLDKQQLKEVMAKGIILYHKSNRRRWPCPTYVLQARTQNPRLLRVVYEQCDNKTTVLAIDDVAQKDSCNCMEER